MYVCVIVQLYACLYTFEHAIFLKFEHAHANSTFVYYSSLSLNANFIYIVGKWLKLMIPQDPLNRWEVVEAHKSEL